MNPLYEPMPKLALCATLTCNRFDHEWVRQHWIEMKKFWDEHYKEEVGLLLGHAGDGDGRSRKLMLEDYEGVSHLHPRYIVGWVGWKYFVAKFPNGDLYGFDDQDQPHNEKKFLNPLDKVSSLLVLGEHFPSLAFVAIVYKQFEPSKHGLNWDDVNRIDIQNWAGP